MLVAVKANKDEVGSTFNAVAIAEVLQGYHRTAKAMEQKLDEVDKKKKLWDKDRDTLLKQCAWLSQENGKLISHDAQLTQEKDDLLQEKSELLRVNAELLAAANSGKDHELLLELQEAHAALQKEKEIATRNLNLLEEKIGTSEELQKQAETLNVEIQSLTGGKENLISEIETLKKEKGFVDLHDWIRRTMRLGELAENKSTPESREEASEILRNTPDLLVRYNPISNLYEYTVGNGSK